MINNERVMSLLQKDIAAYKAKRKTPLRPIYKPI